MWQFSAADIACRDDVCSPDREVFVSDASGPFAPLLDAEAAGVLLCLPASWLLAEARADRIPHVRFGKYVRFDGEELEHWWRARARGPWRDRGAASRAARNGRTGVDPVAAAAGS